MSNEYLKMKLETRINMLSGRQRENGKIIKKLVRQLRNLNI